MALWYFDTSALVKLVVAEPETPALVEWIQAQPGIQAATSDLSRTELRRAVGRVAPELMMRVVEVLDSLIIVGISSAMFDAAGRLGPSSLRTLDAIHCASALEFGDELAGMVLYDHRLKEAAFGLGITTVSPGAPRTA